MVCGYRLVAATGHDSVPPRVVGREDAVVASEMLSRRRDERGQAAQKLEGRKAQLCAPIAQRAPQFHDDVPRGIQREPGIGHRRPAAIATQALEALAVLGVNPALGVQGVAAQKCAAAKRRPPAVLAPEHEHRKFKLRFLKRTE
jgi:hypothetical protein